MHAELVHDVARIVQHVHHVRHRRALVAADVGDAGLQQRLGDREDALAVEGLAFAELEQLDFLLERTFHAAARLVGLRTNSLALPGCGESNCIGRRRLAQLCAHIPDRFEHLVRYAGWYSNRGLGKRNRRSAEPAADLPRPAAPILTYHPVPDIA